MKRKTLQPEQIIVPGEYKLGNDSILKIYFRVFDRGHGDDLPPVIVTKSDVKIEDLEPGLEYKEIIEFIRDCEQKGVEPEPGEDITYKYQHDYRVGHLSLYVNRVRAEERFRERIADEYSGILEKLANLRSQGSRYILIEGNHKSAAATLSHKPIFALELENDGDIEEAHRMVERGELFDFKIPESSLVGLVASFYDFCKDNLEDFDTVKRRIDRLTSNGDLPQYMKEKYLRKK